MSNVLNYVEKVVPPGIRYLSDGDWFKLSDYPKKCIINKQNPGCGFTEYCIRGPENVILCSPRKLLLKNKKDQHLDEVYLVVNSMEKDLEVDVDLSSVKSTESKRKSIENNDLISRESFNLDRNSEIYRKIFAGIDSYISRRKCNLMNPSIKILVTYDSYHIVKDILKILGIFDSFYTVIDEFQSILHDARFKSTTELGFLDHLKKSPTSIFVSATPMLREYMEELEFFKYLPYFELNWSKEDPTRVIKPDLNISYMSSISSKAEEIVQSYLSGNFEYVIIMNNYGQPVRVNSTEAIFYVNSVNHIINIVKRNKLTPNQVNILCADTEDNHKKLKDRLGKDFDIGSIPLKGEPNKMFTLCTRTVYLGADFYSKCARSFIFSDSNSDCLAVDISEDLPQILGRQRDIDNPWKNSANFYYKTTADYRKMTQEDFDKKMNGKIEKTKDLLDAYNVIQDERQKLAIVEKYQSDIRTSNYKNDYVAINYDIEYNQILGKVMYIPRPVVNDLVRVNEKRAFNIQQKDYKDRFTVFATINEKINTISMDINLEVGSFFMTYNSYRTMYEKLKYLCENSLSKEALEIVLSQLSDSDDIKSYYQVLGPKRLHELGYNVTLIRKELGIVTFSPEILLNTIYSNFHVGERYLLSTLKSMLADLYKSISYQATPKAVDITNYFEVKEAKIPVEVNGEKKRMKGYKLVSSKEIELRVKLDLMNKGEIIL